MVALAAIRAAGIAFGVHWQGTFSTLGRPPDRAQKYKRHSPAFLRTGNTLGMSRNVLTFVHPLETTLTCSIGTQPSREAVFEGDLATWTTI